MIRIAICGDEQNYLNKIYYITSKYLRNKKKEYEILEYHSGNELIKDAEQLKKFQILLIDVNMKGIDGITSAREIRKTNENIYIAFIAALIDYAPEGYKLNAIWYILKDSINAALPECLEAILKKINAEALEIYFNDRKISLQADRILFIESRKHKIYIHIFDRKKGEEAADVISLYRKLDDIQKMINIESFLRLSKSYLVNAKYIRGIKNYEAELVTTTILSISREKYSTIKQQYLMYRGQE